MIRDILIRKPGNEVAVLTETAKSGVEAIDALANDRNALAREVIELRTQLDKAILENQGLTTALSVAMEKSDFWMRTNARLEAHLNQLGAIMQTMHTEMRRNPDGNVKQLAEKFAPEVKNVKSVG